MHIEEQRTTERYIAVEPIDGSFGAASITVLNLGGTGAQVAHAQPLRLGTKGRLLFRRGGVQVAVQALLLWSHLSRTPNSEGKYLYQSGLRIDDAGDFPTALRSLLDDGAVRRDLDSLERKRRRLLEKEHERNQLPKVIQPEVSAEQVLLVQHARERLRANPEEATRWYNRAKFAPDGVPEHIPHREDVLAVWEYLERTVDLGTIIRVFEKR
ncbi:MAG TPA: hypothetical protein VGR02_07835 [Thermoanaerobaculia bacterium]|jgi:hypothetical protein|nr:hypothetical protein [Thermoanaerobaculia bacterium]